MMRHNLTLTATIIRHGEATDIYGDAIPGDPSTTTVPAWYWITDTDEESGAAQADHEMARMIVPAGTDIRSTDRVAIGDREWAITAAPRTVARPVIGPSHVEVQLHRRA
jgi:hypothetical protein